MSQRKKRASTSVSASKPDTPGRKKKAKAKTGDDGESIPSLVPPVPDPIATTMDSAGTTSDSTSAVVNVPAQALLPIDVSNFNSQTPLLSVCDELGSNIPDSVRDKIWAGSYIDLAVLVDPGLKEDAPAQKFTIVDGELVIKPKGSEKKIYTIEIWSDAFLVLISVYIKKHADAMQGLLKYMSIVRLAASRHMGMGWKTYDEQFRMKQARNPERPWGVIDGELWLLFIQGGSNPTSKPQVVAYTAMGRCFDFNYKGVCIKSPCPYVHQCLKCWANHSAISCTVQTQATQKPDTKSSQFTGFRPYVTTPSFRAPFQQRNPRPFRGTRPFITNQPRRFTPRPTFPGANSY